MAHLVNPNLIKDVKQYGAFDISACFNCGNCTAVCPLSDEGGSFPRKMIRLGQIGDKTGVLGGPEPWLCYYCGECSQTCPREAEPGEYMAALRRYQIAQYEPTGLGRLMMKGVGWAGKFCASALMNDLDIRLALIASYRVWVSSAGDRPNSSSSSAAYSSYCRSAAERCPAWSYK